MNEIIIAIIGTAFLCIGGSAFAFVKYRRKMQEDMGEVLTVLDRAIGGEYQAARYDEGMDAALTERLNRLVEMTNMQKERAESERDLVKTMISDISHQVRTPLSNILLYTGLLAETQNESDDRQLTGKIIQNCNKLDFFLKELVKSSYAEEDGLLVGGENAYA